MTSPAQATAIPWPLLSETMTDTKQRSWSKAWGSLLILSLMGNLVMIGRSWLLNFQWETEMEVMAGYAAAIQARADFENGVRRQYELSLDGKTEYLHRNDGAFEVWSYAYYPILGHGHVFGEQRYVEVYNSKMRYMYQHPERFLPGSAGGHNYTTRPTTSPAG
jgi:hypothetical protein